MSGLRYALLLMTEKPRGFVVRDPLQNVEQLVGGAIHTKVKKLLGQLGGLPVIEQGENWRLVGSIEREMFLIKEEEQVYKLTAADAQEIRRLLEH